MATTPCTACCSARTPPRASRCDCNFLFYAPGPYHCDARANTTHPHLRVVSVVATVQNYLMMANVTLPLPDTEIDARKYEDEKGEVGGFGGSNAKVEIKVKIKHEGEVNRAR